MRRIQINKSRPEAPFMTLDFVRLLRRFLAASEDCCRRPTRATISSCRVGCSGDQTRTQTNSRVISERRSSGKDGVCFLSAAVGAWVCELKAHMRRPGRGAGSHRFGSAVSSSACFRESRMPHLVRAHHQHCFDCHSEAGAVRPRAACQCYSRVAHITSAQLLRSISFHMSASVSTRPPRPAPVRHDMSAEGAQVVSVLRPGTWMEMEERECRSRVGEDSDRTTEPRPTLYPTPTLVPCTPHLAMSVVSHTFSQPPYARIPSFCSLTRPFLVPFLFSITAQ